MFNFICFHTHLPSSVEISTYLNQFYTLYTFLKSKEIDTVKCHNLVLHQMWWVYNLKNYFKLQLLEFLL
ncbi:hypothetical protein DDL18_11240, partial [Staphylococcus aureus]